MEVSQGDLARLLIGALFCGFLLAGGRDIVRQAIVAIVVPIDPERLSPRVMRLYHAIIPVCRRSPLQRHQTRNRFSRTVGQIFRSAAQFIYDVFFAIILAASLLLLFYMMNDGGFRLSAVLMMLVGIFLYQLTLKKGMNRICSIVAVLTQSLMLWGGWLLFWPLRRVWKCTIRPRRWVLARLEAIRRYLKQKIQRRRQRLMDVKRQEKAEQQPDRISVLRERQNGKKVYVSGKKQLP